MNYNHTFRIAQWDEKNQTDDRILRKAEDHFPKVSPRKPEAPNKPHLNVITSQYSHVSSK